MTARPPPRAVLRGQQVQKGLLGPTGELSLQAVFQYRSGMRSRESMVCCAVTLAALGSAARAQTQDSQLSTEPDVSTGVPPSQSPPQSQGEPSAELGTEAATSAADPEPSPGPTELPPPPPPPEPSPTLAPSTRPVAASESRVQTVDLRDVDDPATRSAYYHDGFYARFGFGFSGYTEYLRSRTSSIYGGRIEGNTTGIANVTEFALGGTVGPGFVLGGALYTVDVLAATFRTQGFGDTQPPQELDPERRSLVFVGPFVDWYFKPERGLHLQMALGFTALSAQAPGFRADDEDADDRYRALGASALAGFGYEWFVGPELSVGLQARITVGATTGKDEQDVRWYNVVATSPGFLFTGTYH